MSCQYPNSLALESIPDIDIVIVISSKEDPTRSGECNRGDSAQDVVVGVSVEFAIGAQVEQLARGVVGTGRKGVSIGEESEAWVRRATL